MNATLLVSVLLACNNSADAPAPAALSPQPPQAAVVGMLGEAPEEVGYHYSPVGKRDPFRSFVEGAPLGIIPPAAYRVLGVVWDIDTPQALVVGEDGRSFVVEEGSLLGSSWGRVDRISADGVEVVTQYVTIVGDEVEERVVLKLREG